LPFYWSNQIRTSIIH